MKKVVFKKKSVSGFKDFYTKEEPYENISLSMLAYFLKNTSLLDVDYYLDWAKNPDENIFAGCNDLYMKYENNQIIVDWELNEDHEDPNHIFVTNPSEMTKILDDWKKILELDPSPDEIIIIQDDSGKVSFETKFYDKK